MTISPILVFAYNRPDHLRKTISSLQKNRLAAQSDLFIFSDGNKNEIDRAQVQQVREFIKKIDGFKSINIILEERNKGLADSIVGGVNEIIKKYDRFIVLEDDIITSEFFLEFMNQSLEIYKDVPTVMHINSYFYPIQNSLPETFFLDRITSWGWGSWARCWKSFYTDSNKLVNEIKNKTNGISSLNLKNSFNFYHTLKMNATGKLHTWAIKWQTYVILQDGLCLFPNKSLSKNIGFDNSGTNCDSDTSFDSTITQYPIQVTYHQPFINKKAEKMVKEFYKKYKKNILFKIYNRIFKWLIQK